MPSHRPGTRLSRLDDAELRWQLWCSPTDVRVRSLAPPVSAHREDDWLRFDQAEYGVAPGQAAVAYDGTRLLGGGWIAETVSAHQSLMDAAAA